MHPMAAIEILLLVHSVAIIISVVSAILLSGIVVDRRIQVVVLTHLLEKKAVFRTLPDSLIPFSEKRVDKSTPRVQEILLLVMQLLV